jgi:hypothetical protein
LSAVALAKADRKSKIRRAGSRIRTDDLLITNQLLYQLSYAGAAHMKAGLAISSRVRPTIALHHK